MDYSAANHALWNFIIQLGMIAGAVLFANFLRQRVAFIRKSLMPIAVLAGFLLLALKYAGLISVDEKLFEMLVYHGIALGFASRSKDRAAPEISPDSNPVPSSSAPIWFRASSVCSSHLR